MITSAPQWGNTLNWGKPFTPTEWSLFAFLVVLLLLLGYGLIRWSHRYDRRFDKHHHFEDNLTYFPLPTQFPQYPFPHWVKQQENLRTFVPRLSVVLEEADETISQGEPVQMSL